jgi:hypothetical protein
MAQHNLGDLNYLCEYVVYPRCRNLVLPLLPAASQSFELRYRRDLPILVAEEVATLNYLRDLGRHHRKP